MKFGRATRDAYGEVLVELGRENPDIVVLDADLSKSTRTKFFAKEFPNRFFDFGIAEANMMGTAAGLASCGKIPFASTFAVFAAGRVFDQVRMSIAYSHLNVKIVASHGGISVGADGASHHSIEDIALACSWPGFVVVVPADEVATRALVRLAAERVGPVYMRLGRPRAPLVYEDGCDFAIGRANALRRGDDVTIIANGLMVAQALEAAQALGERGIEARMLDMHTVKPLDREAVVKAARETGAIVVAEEHLLHGGLGSEVAQVVAEECPVPIGFVAIRDTYCESGKPEELFEKYGLTAGDILRAVERTVARK